MERCVSTQACGLSRDKCRYMLNLAARIDTIRAALFEREQLGGCSRQDTARLRERLGREALVLQGRAPDRYDLSRLGLFEQKSDERLSLVLPRIIFRDALQREGLERQPRLAAAAAYSRLTRGDNDFTGQLCAFLGPIADKHDYYGRNVRNSLVCAVTLALHRAQAAEPQFHAERLAARFLKRLEVLREAPQLYRLSGETPEVSVRQGVYAGLFNRCPAADGWTSYIESRPLVPRKEIIPDNKRIWSMEAYDLGRVRLMTLTDGTVSEQVVSKRMNPRKSREGEDEWRISAIAFEAGVATPEPLAQIRDNGNIYCFWRYHQSVPVQYAWRKDLAAQERKNQQALAAAGIEHFDLFERNRLVTVVSGRPTLMLLDFERARLVNGSAEQAALRISQNQDESR